MTSEHAGRRSRTAARSGRFRRRFPVAALAVVLALALDPAAGAQRQPPADPGWVDLGALGLGSGEASLEIFLEGPLIRMVAEAVRGEDARFADLLGKLRSVRVQVFPLESADGDQALRRSDDTASRLEGRGWKPVFRVREGDERIFLYLKENAAGTIDGVFVMAAQPGDSVTLVNIVGDFDPVELGRLGASLDIDPLEMLGRMARGAAQPGAEDEP
jgi:hypothetical protein